MDRLSTNFKDIPRTFLIDIGSGNSIPGTNEPAHWSLVAVAQTSLHIPHQINSPPRDDVHDNS